MGIIYRLPNRKCGCFRCQRWWNLSKVSRENTIMLLITISSIVIGLKNSVYFPLFCFFVFFVLTLLLRRHLRAWTNGKCLATKHHQTLFDDQTFYRLDTLFGAVWSCVIVCDRVWYILKAIKHSIKNLQHFFCSVFDGRCFVRLGSRVSNVFDAGMPTTLAQRLVSIVWFVFDQTCFNRLATHFNISMFGDQTMFDGVWSPNNSRLSRP